MDSEFIIYTEIAMRNARVSHAVRGCTMDDKELNNINGNSDYLPVTRNTGGRGEIANRRNNGNSLWSGWDPFPDFSRVFSEITEMFEHFTRQITGMAGLPEADITRSNGNVIVKIEIPGLNRNNLDAEVCEDYIRLAGKQNRKNEYRGMGDRTYRSEESFSAFFRTLPLPVRVKQEEAKVEYRGDVVYITVPEA